MAGGGIFKVEFSTLVLWWKFQPYGWKFWTIFISGIIHLSRIQCLKLRKTLCTRDIIRHFFRQCDQQMEPVGSGDRRCTYPVCIQEQFV